LRDKTISVKIPSAVPKGIWMRLPCVTLAGKRTYRERINTQRKKKSSQNAMKTSAANQKKKQNTAASSAKPKK
jgi:hypothetical protein